MLHSVNEPETVDDLMTPREASEWLKISLTTLWRRTVKREIPVLRFGGTIRYSKAMILEQGRENGLEWSGGRSPEGGTE